MLNVEPVYSRCLVIGSGIAGLQFALLAAEHGTVRVATKKESKESNTNYAQGGIAAVLSPLDDFDLHVRDTIAAGAGLCRREVIEKMVQAAPELIERLIGYGVLFTRTGDGSELSLGREGGHSRNRIAHAGDLTGRELERRLVEACAADPRVTIDENHMGLDLIKARDLGDGGDEADRVVGCWILDRDTREVRPYLADTVVLATGGCGKVYAYTSNPDIATGDGLAMAYRAGATLANLEFVQFHPTCLYHPEAKSFLISEAVRGEGARLIDSRGERFMERYHPQQELAPRDIVARGIDQEMKLRGDPCVYLDLRHLDRGHVEKRFPNLCATCARFGIDMAGEPVPVVPAAHYMCGGVRVDMSGRTDIPGLLAVGEVACTGVHGGNRLASNSLLEAVYFAETAAAAAGSMKPYFDGERRPATPVDVASAADSGDVPEAMVLEHDWDVVRRVMWDYVGIVRNEARLQIAQRRVRSIRGTVEQMSRRSLPDADLAELRNISLLAELIILCARERTESRGLHFTQDHPGPGPGEPEDTLIGLKTDLRTETGLEPWPNRG